MNNLSNRNKWGKILNFNNIRTKYLSQYLYTLHNIYTLR